MNAEPFMWVVLFESAPTDGEYSPVVSYLPRTPFLHGFDADMVQALPAMWACLHLPRSFSDCRDVSFSLLKQAEELDVPHFVLTFPLGELRAARERFKPPLQVALVIAPDESVLEVTRLVEPWTPAFGVVGYGSLNQEAIDDYWNRIGQLGGPMAERRRGPPLTDFANCGVERLTVLHRIRQYCPPDRRADIGCAPLTAEVIRESLGAAKYARAWAILEEGGCSAEDAPGKFDEALKAAVPSWHLAVGSAGVPALISKLAASAPNRPPPELRAASVRAERRALDIIVAHRAIARGGFGMILPDVPVAAFSQLRELEDAMGSSQPLPRQVQKVLSRIGHTLGGMLTPEQCEAFRAARSVTVFSDFPWGLAVLPGDTSPLATCTPVVYRPLTPLTRALQLELTPSGSLYLADGVSVLIAECIEPEDPIRPVSERSWRGQINQLADHGQGRVRAEFRCISELAELYKALDEQEYDVVVISAHGITCRDGRRAGLRIGKDDVYEIEHRLPPVVVFSACSVWARGAGRISIADLALRWGAQAIVGTLFPINVRHHAFVVSRIFVYMVESLSGREPERTLADVVRRALSSNAVLDVLHGSRRIQDWAFGRGASGSSPLEEFMNRRAVGKLRRGHIYADTEKVLAEIAGEHGTPISNQFRQFLRSRGYIQESLFYAMIGRPESIVLQARNSAEAALRAEHKVAVGSASPQHLGARRRG